MTDSLVHTRHFIKIVKRYLYYKVMIVIDGSYLEGGGQIARTAIALSAINNVPVKIEKIRSGRYNPGLRNQHFHSIKTASEICGAEIEGLEVGSECVSFYPGKIRGGKYNIDIGTAGSITLFLQLIIPITLFADRPTTIRINGGTDVKWSPSSDYFKNIFIGFLKKFGINATYDLVKRGFYPKGGGEVVFNSVPWKNKKHVGAIKRGELEEIYVKSIASKHLKNANVAERQIKGFRKDIKANKKESEYVDSLSIGSTIYSEARYKHFSVGSTSLGERGKKAELVGEQCAKDLKKEIKREGVDVHLGDQIVPYLAIAGGKVKLSDVSMHTKTNVWVCQKFGYKIGIVEDEIVC